MFDPDTSGTGHQPLGFDQWAAIYKYYMVYAIKWSFYIMSVDLGEGRVGVIPSQNIITTTPGNQQGLFEQPGGRWRFIQARSSGSTKTIAKISGYTTVGAILGVRSLDWEYHGAQFNSSPVTQCYLNVIAENEAVGQANYRCYVKLVYYAKLWSRNVLWVS